MALRSDRELNNRNEPELSETAGELNGALVGSLDRTSGAIEVIVGGCFGAGFGYLIDRQFDISPTFTVILAIAGFLACCLSLYRRFKAEFALHEQERLTRSGRTQR